ncbi:MAG TPA: hypothetical protein VIW24_15930 [Aldersonia sp.]
MADNEIGLAIWGVALSGTSTVGARPSFSANSSADAMSLIGPTGTRRR